MLMTVTNLQSSDMGDLDVYYAGVQGTPSSMAATGGARKDPLPFPFDRNGKIAAGGSKTLPVRTSDFRRQNTPFTPLAPSDEWQQLIQAGKIGVFLSQEAAQALLIPGAAAAANGGVKYTAKRQGVRIWHKNGGALAVAVAGLDIEVTLNSGTSTASDVVTAIGASAAASALVSSVATGNGAGLAGDSSPQALKQIPYSEMSLEDKLIAGL